MVASCMTVFLLFGSVVGWSGSSPPVDQYPVVDVLPPRHAPPSTTTIPTTVPPAPPTTHVHPPTTHVHAPTETAAVVPQSGSSVGGDPSNMASWDRLAGCETGGTMNWAINTGNGYYGGLQFSLGSWQSVGGTGLPSDASRETQIAMGQRLYNSGGWQHWPACTRSFGWR